MMRSQLFQNLSLLVKFGFESAVESRAKAQRRKGSLSYSYLLPAGEAALQGWEAVWEKGGTYF